MEGHRGGISTTQKRVKAEAQGRKALGGLTHFAVCAAVARGATTIESIRKFTASRVGNSNLQNLLANLCKKGALQLRDGEYRLTYIGREILGARGPVNDLTPLQLAPRPPMRPGADVAARLPSMAAGRLWSP